MSQYFLDGSQICTVREQIGCECMPEIMRRGGSIDAGSIFESVVYILYFMYPYLLSISVDKNFIRVTCVTIA